MQTGHILHLGLMYVYLSFIHTLSALHKLVFSCEFYTALFLFLTFPLSPFLLSLPFSLPSLLYIFISSSLSLSLFHFIPLFSLAFLLSHSFSLLSFSLPFAPSLPLPFSFPPFFSPSLSYSLPQFFVSLSFLHYSRIFTYPKVLSCKGRQ